MLETSFFKVLSTLASKIVGLAYSFIVDKTMTLFVIYLKSSLRL